MSSIENIVKRDGSIRSYQRGKITEAILQALQAVDSGDRSDAIDVAKIVEGTLEKRYSDTDFSRTDETNGDPKSVFPEVEEIQDVVESSLMSAGYHDAAKEYILYRQERAKQRERSLFKKREQLKPYEYPELAEYVDAIRHSYWIHTEFNYTGDVHDYKVNVTESERSVIKKTMLAIAQIEVAVKTFWGDLYEQMPKPEIGSVGFTFSESEVRHMDAYSHLLDVLGLNDEFEQLQEVPVIQDRMDYLQRVIAMSRTGDKQEYTRSILLFSLFVEHVSLFSQFLIIMSFNKHKNLFKGISNVVEATSKEEQIHGLFGIDLINLIRDEHPEWFDASFEESVRELCQNAYGTEQEMVSWMYEEGELDFLPKDVVMAFVKDRLNNSLEAIGYDAEFDTDDELVEETSWFDEEVIATKHVDFFDKRSINYNKRQQSVTSDDLF